MVAGPTALFRRVSGFRIIIAFVVLLLAQWFAIKTKISPISGWRDAETMTKGAAKGIGALKTDRGGNGIDRNILGGQTPPRFIQPSILYESAGRLTKGRLETPDEMPWRETGTIGQDRDREIALRVGCDPTGQ